MTEPVAGLEARNLHLWRGDRHVLRGLSFAATTGEAVHVRGANGTGKTTLLKTLAGFLHPEEGAVYWDGRPAVADRDGYAAALAYLGHENGLKGDLTVGENLRFSVGLRRTDDSLEADRVLNALGGGVEQKSLVRTLSAGQRRRVALARVALFGARLWLLDEPFTNLDADATRAAILLIAAHVRRGGIALLTAHAALDWPGSLRSLDLT